MFYLGRIKVNLNQVVIMAVLNVSPESFYQGSVRGSEQEIKEFLEAAVKGGAKIIDVGGMSTAPYKQTFVPEEVELERVRKAIRAINETSLPVEISVDTQRSRVAEEALRLGATILNDISGFSDPNYLKLAKEYSASVIAVAHGKPEVRVDPVNYVIDKIREAVEKARSAGIEDEKITVDPAIGFIRPDWIESYSWDAEVLSRLKEIKEAFNKPLLLGVSRKSFIGGIAGEKDPAKRLPGSISAEVIGACLGANVIRTHDVAETYQALKVAEKILRSFELL